MSSKEKKRKLYTRHDKLIKKTLLEDENDIDCSEFLNVHDDENSAEFENKFEEREDLTEIEIKKRKDIKDFYEHYYFDNDYNIHEHSWKLMKPCFHCEKIMPCEDCAAQCVSCDKKVCHSCNYKHFIMWIHDCCNNKPWEIWRCEDCILACLVCKSQSCIECSIQDEETTKLYDYTEPFSIECCKNDQNKDSNSEKCIPQGKQRRAVALQQHFSAVKHIFTNVYFCNIVIKWRNIVTI
jgi:hypothetical protein